MPQTAKRLAHFTESVIREMTRVANRYDAINLSQGFPDADPPPEVLAAGERAMREGPHQYAITWGAPRFRQALVRQQRHWMGLDLDPERHVAVTCGSTEAMMCAMTTACNPGDRVIIFSPYYEKLRNDYTRKKDLFLSYLDEAGIVYTKPQGAYYVLVDCTTYGVKDDLEFCRWMAKTVGVAAVPGSSFFHTPMNHLIRLPFSRSEAVLAETGKRLRKIKSLL